MKPDALWRLCPFCNHVVRVQADGRLDVHTVQREEGDYESCSGSGIVQQRAVARSSKAVSLARGRVTFEFGNYRAQRREDGIWYFGDRSHPMPPVVPSQGALTAAIEEILLLRAENATLVVEKATAWQHVHDLNQAAIEKSILDRDERAQR